MHLYVFLAFALVLARGAKAASDPALNDAMEKTSRYVELFWKQFSSVTCIESVTQEKLGNKNKVEYEQKSIFDYLIFMNFKGEDLRVEESRLLQKTVGKSKNLPLLVTSGFPTLLLVFHPYYQGDYLFKLDGSEETGGKVLTRIHFAHIPGLRSTSALRLRGRDFPLDMQGTAWVDSKTGVIEKMSSSLMAPMTDLNLKALKVKVAYAPQEFSSRKDPEWLPSTAAIEVETARQHWRNVHQFSSYKQFSVESESTVKK